MSGLPVREALQSPRSKESHVDKPSYCLIAHIERQRDFSRQTFGPDVRTAGVIAHIRKELDEVTATPHDLSEWVDIILLAIDGAWRHGFTPEQIAAGLEAKQSKNENRTWPDWRTSDPNGPIEHIKHNL